MLAEIITMVAIIIANGRGLSDSKHRQHIERLSRKYDVPLADAWVAFDKQYNMALGFDYDEATERRYIEQALEVNV